GERAVGDVSLHLPQRAFARQLDQLRRTHEVVTLDEAMMPTSPPRRPRAVITFDDAYRGAVRAGVDELVRRSMPATLFVSPAFIDGGSFWWDVLADESGLAEEVRTNALETLQGKDEAIRRWAKE